MTPTKPQEHSVEYVTLRDYFESRINALEQATDLSHKVLDTRLASMNEFRSAMKDQQDKFVTKTEYCITKEHLDDDIRSLRESRAMLEGKASQSGLNVTLAISIISLLIGVVGIVLRLAGL